MNFDRLLAAGTMFAAAVTGSVASESNTIVPLEISQGFNVDLIVENLPVKEHADFVFDSYYAFYTTNVVEEEVEIKGALTTPDNHTLVSSNGIAFELAAFDGKNALYADTKNTEYTLRFSEGINADKLYVLCNSNSSRTMMATIYYSDGTESEEIELEVSSAKYTSYNKDEFAITDKLIIDDEEYTSSKYYGFNVFELAADESKEAVAVSFYCTKNPQFFVYAVSASADVSGTAIKLQTTINKLNLAPFSTDNIVVKYDFNGEERAANFGCTAEASDACVSVGKITEDAAEATFTIPVEALTETGTADLTITVTNGEFSKKCIVPVKIAKPSLFLGWTHDVIAEGLPSNEKVTAPLDESGWALYTTGVKEEGAIAGADGVVTTSNGTTFQLQPYDEPNALKLTQNVPATLEMTKPAECNEVRILAISANGDATVNVTVKYTDGTESESTTITIPDWYGDDTDTAIHGVDRVFTKTNDWDHDLDDFDGRMSFRLYEFTLTTDAEKMLESVTFEATKRRVYPSIIALAVDEAKAPEFAEVTLASETSTYKVDEETSMELVVSYTLGEGLRADDFNCTATASNDLVKIGEIVENVDAQTFTIPVAAGKGSGETEVAVTVTNGDKTAVHSFAITVEKVSGIDTISVAAKSIEAIYTLQGTLVQNPGTGLYIVRYTDGSVGKLIIR